MKYLLDVNALVALGFLRHEFHERVALWVRATQVSSLATCSITELGFVRVLTQATTYGFSLQQAQMLLLRLKKTNVLQFTLSLMITIFLVFQLGSGQQNRLRMATWLSSLPRMERFLQRSMKGFQDRFLSLIADLPVQVGTVRTYRLSQAEPF